MTLNAVLRSKLLGERNADKETTRRRSRSDTRTALLRAPRPRKLRAPPERDSLQDGTRKYAA